MRSKAGSHVPEAYTAAYGNYTRAEERILPSTEGRATLASPDFFTPVRPLSRQVRTHLRRVWQIVTLITCKIDRTPHPRPVPSPRYYATFSSPFPGRRKTTSRIL